MHFVPLIGRKYGMLSNRITHILRQVGLKKLMEIISRL